MSSGARRSPVVPALSGVILLFRSDLDLLSQRAALHSCSERVRLRAQQIAPATTRMCDMRVQISKTSLIGDRRQMSHVRSERERLLFATNVSTNHGGRGAGRRGGAGKYKNKLN